MRIALVHDYLLQFGGAERVLCALSELFPDAPIYTLLYDRKKMAPWFGDKTVRVSFLDKLPKSIQARHRLLLPFFSCAASALDVSAFDVVISSSSSFAKGVRVKPGAVHISYCHSPTRFLWDYEKNYLRDNRYKLPVRMLLKPLIALLKKWDKRAARGVHFWIANSKTVQERIASYYGASATVIYPPFLLPDSPDTKAPLYAHNYFLVVSRLSAYKKIDLIIETFNHMQLPLIIIGDGPERERLEKIAKINTTFLGCVDDAALTGYYQNCKAVIVACEEDFGLTALEAAHYGKPVLAYRKGGVAEWLEEGKTGEFFNEHTPESLAEGVYKISARAYVPAYLKNKASQFSKESFQRAISQFVSNAISNAIDLNKK